MKSTNSSIALLLVGGLLLASSADAGPFGAYYTKIDSGEPFEQFSRTGAHADIVVDLPDLGLCIEVVVEDSGIGIAPQDLDLIFEKFYRTGEVELHSSGTTKFKGGGPGLGLAIARGGVEAHGGRIWAESPGYDEKACPGSRFIVQLPFVEVGQDSVATPPGLISNATTPSRQSDDGKKRAVAA